VTAFIRGHGHPDAPSAEPLRTAWKDIIASDELEDLSPIIPRPTPFIHDSEVGSELRGDLDGKDAHAALLAIHDAFVNGAERLVGHLGTAECLFWLRRLRGQFAVVNNLPSTEAYVQDVAEALVTRTARPSKPIEGLAEINYELDEDKLMLLGVIHVLAAEVYELHSVMKRCAKGQAVRFAPTEMPTWVRDPVLDAVIKRLDRRTMRDQAGALAALGIASHDDPLQLPRLPIGGHVPLWYRLNPPGRLTFTAADPPPYLVGSLNLDTIQELHSGEALNEDQVALVALLWTCLLAAGDPTIGRLRITPMFQWGYAVLHTEGVLLPSLERTLVEMRDNGGAAVAASPKLASAVDVLTVLAGLETEVYAPMAGNPIHPAADQSVVDLVGASHRLLATLSRPRDGNVRSWTEKFENDVQAVIDESPWRPEGAIRDLQRKKIRRRDGTELTDVDAVALRGRQLLLVSCKSFAVTREVARGDYRITPTSLDRSHEALAKWTTVIDEIRNDPELLGQRLPAEIQIDGCIVFPIVPYYSEPAGDRRVFRHIPVLLAISELKNALNRG
jgi:hypothetical protein